MYVLGMNPGGWFEHVLKTPRLFRDLTTLELVTVPGYALERMIETEMDGGGALYIRNKIDYERSFDLEYESLEWIGIKVIKPKGRVALGK